MPVVIQDQLAPAIFFQAVTLRLAPLLPFELRGFEHRRQGRLMKVHYGEAWLHYEAAHHPARGRMEVGLHLEGSPDQNRAGFTFLRARMVEIKGRLPEAELEPWDRGWARLYETQAGAALSTALAESTAERLAAFITTLQPLLADRR